MYQHPTLTQEEANNVVVNQVITALGFSPSQFTAEALSGMSPSLPNPVATGPHELLDASFASLMRSFLRSTQATTLPAITMTQDGHNVTIDAVVRTWGADADRYIAPGLTFRQAAINGIYNNWGGHRGGLYVTVNITDIGQGAHLLQSGQGWVGIEIRDSAGVSHLAGVGNGSRWSTMNPGRLVLFTSDSRNGHIATAGEFGLISAHEFGHALGIADGLGFSVNPVVSIMNENWWSGRGASRLDLEMALRAQQTDTWQRWIENFDLYQEYGERR